MPDQPDVQDSSVEETQDPTTDTDVVEEAPETPDQADETTEDVEPSPEGTSEADDEESSDDDSEAFTDVDLESLSEEERGRYEQMQADYTRKTQALAEQRSELESTVNFVTDLVADDPSEEQSAMQEQVFRALAERLGYELEDDETQDDEEGDEPSDEAVDSDDPAVKFLLDKEREREEQAQAEAQAKAEEQFEAQLDELEEGIENGLKELAEKDGVELSDEELDLLFDKVVALPPVDGDQPDVKGAYAALQSVLNVNKKRWIDSKKANPAPNGEQGGEKSDLSTPEGRQAHLARIVEASQGRSDQ